MRPLIALHSVLGEYNIQFVNNLSMIESLIDADNTFTFIDKNVEQLYPTLRRLNNVSVVCVESNKTYEMSAYLLEQMVKLGVKSNSTILVIGGGILQDLVGFCCSVYHRGVNYILIPTTLLAQADSCVGGKTSINFQKKKNILGTFYPPKQIIIYSGFLHTLSDIEYRSGLGEIYKFHILQNKMNVFGVALNKSNIDDTIYDALLYKKTILDIDEFDKKERKFLNFGHTFGHALEFTSTNQLPHGIAVILGSITSIILSEHMGYTVPNLTLTYGYARQLLAGIPLQKQWFEIHSILEAAKLDKKNTGNIVDVLFNNGPVLTTLYDTAIIEHSLLRTFELVYNETI